MSNEPLILGDTSRFDPPLAPPDTPEQMVDLVDRLRNTSATPQVVSGFVITREYLNGVSQHRFRKPATNLRAHRDLLGGVTYDVECEGEHYFIYTPSSTITDIPVDESITVFPLEEHINEPTRHEPFLPAPISTGPVISLPAPISAGLAISPVSLTEFATHPANWRGNGTWTADSGGELERLRAESEELRELKAKLAVPKPLPEPPDPTIPSKRRFTFPEKP